MAKFKQPGRPAGAPNNKSVFVRNENIHYRVSEGLNKTIDALMATGNYKSKADIVHEAVQLLAIRKLTKKVDMYWINKIM